MYVIVCGNQKHSKELISYRHAMAMGVSLLKYLAI